jgi:hypothetical protein
MGGREKFQKKKRKKLGGGWGKNKVPKKALKSWGKKIGKGVGKK